MIEIDGKRVFTELSELVDPRHAALPIVDMQRDLVVSGRAFDRPRVDLSMFPPMIPRLRRCSRERSEPTDRRCRPRAASSRPPATRCSTICRR